MTVALVDQLRADLRSAHVKAQAARLGRLFAVAVVAQLGVVGTGHLDRTVLVGVLVGAAETLWREYVPTVPWSVLQAAWAAVAARKGALKVVPPPSDPPSPPGAA